MDRGVTDLYEALIRAWNEQDADGMAACFADDGAMIGFDGTHARGRREIIEHLGAVFGDHETARFVFVIKTVREIGERAALLHAAAGMIPPGESDLNPRVNTHHTVVAEKDSDSWRIALFQNTPAQFHGRPEETERWTDELRGALRASGGS